MQLKALTFLAFLLVPTAVAADEVCDALEVAYDAAREEARALRPTIEEIKDPNVSMCDVAKKERKELKVLRFMVDLARQMVPNNCDLGISLVTRIDILNMAVDGLNESERMCAEEAPENQSADNDAFVNDSDSMLELSYSVVESYSADPSPYPPGFVPKSPPRGGGSTITFPGEGSDDDTGPGGAFSAQ